MRIGGLFGGRGKRRGGGLGGTDDEDAEAPRGVAEALSHLVGGEVFDEEGPQCLVLAVSGVGGFEEEGGVVRYPFFVTVRHLSTVSCYAEECQALGAYLVVESKILWDRRGLTASSAWLQGE